MEGAGEMRNTSGIAVALCSLAVSGFVAAECWDQPDLCTGLDFEIMENCDFFVLCTPGFVENGSTFNCGDEGLKMVEVECRRLAAGFHAVEMPCTSAPSPGYKKVEECRIEDGADGLCCFVPIEAPYVPFEQPRAAIGATGAECPSCAFVDVLDL